MAMQVNRVQLFLVAVIALYFAQSAIAKQICLVGECSAMTTEFRNLELRPESIALLPPRATLRKKGVLSSEDMVGETATLEDSLANALEERMTKLGYAVRRVTPKDIEANAELARLLSEANQRYDEERANLLAGELSEIRYRRYTAGAEARILANYLDVEAIAFPRMQAVGATGSAIVFSPTGGGQIHMGFGLVHARTGDIEAFFGAINQGGLFGKSLSSILEKPDRHMLKIVKTATKKMPDVAKALRPEKLDNSRIQALELHDKVDQEAVLSDLESLLAEPKIAEDAASDE